MDTDLVTENEMDTSISLNMGSVLPVKVASTNSYKMRSINTTKVPIKHKSKTKLSRQKTKPIPLTIYHQNIRGLRGKTNALLCQLYPTPPHILCLSEHHMNPSELQQTFLGNYKLGASYCRTSYEKGGICIYVQESLSFVKIDLEKYCKDKDLEICAIKISFNSKSAHILAIYRAPSGNFELFISKLDSILKKLHTATTECIICGDINVNFLAHSDRKSRLESLLTTYNLTNVVNFPTRTQKLSATAIDSIFIDTLRMRNYSICSIINGLSDHDAQSIKLPSFSPELPPKKYRVIREINEYTINDFHRNLSYETWESVFSTEDVNRMFNSFLDSYLKIFNSSFPLKRVYSANKSTNWITPGIITSCNRKRELFIATRNSNNLALIKHYKRYCKILSIVIKEAKKLYYANKIKKSSNKNKTIWDIVTSETNKSVITEKTNTINFEGKLISDRQEIANAFNQYFLTIAKNINTKLNELSPGNSDITTPLSYLVQSFKNHFPKFTLKSVSTKEIENIIKSFKPKNSSGYDGVSNKLIKISSPFISSPLTHICNKSLSSGTFPDRMKYAVVTPIFKKGDKHELSNYRPISILSSFSKVLEKVMYNQLQKHLNKHCILAEDQFGFRPDSTTENAIYKLINEALNALNNKLIVGGIFFDLEKAFDCLNHSILLTKLQFYGVRGKAKAWFESYLKNRYMRVQTTDEGLNQTSFSAWEKITDGVPQGSILGPLLFLVYINDLPKTISDKTVPILFADDTSIIVKSPNPKDFQTNMVTAFNSVNKWFKANLLSINVNKTYQIQFKTKNKPTLDISIACNDNPITYSPTIKFLGIYIHDTINWNYHIEYIIPKLSSACYIMRSIKQIMSYNTLKTVYYSYFNAIINYGLPFWGNSPHAIKIFRMQKRIIRIMMGCGNRASCRNLFRRLEILPLGSQYILSLMLFVVKNKNYFSLNSENHTKSTRQSNNLYQPTTNLTIHQRGIHYTGIKIFNNLPPHIKNSAANVRNFEINLKRFLHTHSFYTLEEYLQYSSITGGK